MQTNRLAGGLTASLFSLSLVLAVAPPAAQAADAVPNVARLSLVQGNVAVERSGSKTNVAGVLNAPLDDGDALTAGKGARAEVQFDGTSALRVDSGAQVRFATLDAGNRVIDVARGTVSLDLFDNAPVLPEIDTPSATIRADEDGRYRVTVADDGTTFVTVRAGKAQIDLPQGTQYLVPGTTMKIAGSASNPTYRVVAFVPTDDFDRFNENRDSVLIAALASSQVPSDVAAGNLNAYGAWVYDPMYGDVWVPYANQTVDWAPYRDGSWSWGSQFGWTWVSYEPWGWAPYHYGRWFYNYGHGGWCWYPPRHRRTPWAPALVGWLTFGSGNFNLAVGIGNVGWVPLAPWETYYPWYGYDHRRGWHGTTIGTAINVTNINNYYGNASHGGATSVPGRRFTQGSFEHNRAITPGDLHHAVAYNGAIPVHATAHNATFGAAHTLPVSLRNERFTMDGRMPARTATQPAPRTKKSVEPVAHRGPPTHVNVWQAGSEDRQAPTGGGDAWARFAQSRDVQRAPGRDVRNVMHGATTGNANTARRSTTQTFSSQSTNDAWSRFQHDRGTYRVPQSPQQQNTQPQQRQWPQQQQPQQRREPQQPQQERRQPQQQRQWPQQQQPQERRQPQERQQAPPPPQPQQRQAPPPQQQQQPPPPPSERRSDDRSDSHSHDRDHK